jgi:hypothetical protein
MKYLTNFHKIHLIDHRGDFQDGGAGLRAELVSISRGRKLEPMRLLPRGMKAHKRTQISMTELNHEGLFARNR